MRDNIRVLHCPNLVGGNPQGLARAERELGLASYAVAFRQNYLQYKTDEVLFAPNDHLVMQEIKRWKFLWRVLRQFDIIHFNFGESLMPIRRGWGAANLPAKRKLNVFDWYREWLELQDLPLLKRMGKGIVVTFQGDDARQGDYSRANFPINIAQEVAEDYYAAGSDQHKRWRINRFATYADRIFALNPDLLHVLPAQAQFMPYAHIDLQEWQPVKQEQGASTKPPVVLHAPSHRGAKGTRFVLEAVARLQSEGIPFEFVLVEQLSNAEARKLYAKADLLIDQLLAGWYGALALELMALGKPVFCYIREADLKFIPAAMRQELPLINITPDTLYTVLKDYLTVRRHELPALGQRSRQYVESWHDPLKIAAQLKAEYEAIMASKRSGRANKGG
ncbi:MAG: glycosyltransferase [Caldilineaceae bacterium]